MTSRHTVLPTCLTLLHSEQLKLYGGLAVLSATGLKSASEFGDSAINSQTCLKRSPMGNGRTSDLLIQVHLHCIERQVNP